MSYVDAIHDPRKNIVQVVERNELGNRVYVDYPAEYTFYYSHAAGSQLSIFGDPVKRFVTNDGRKFTRELGKYKWERNKNGTPKYKIFESDIRAEFRTLAAHYKNADAPKLHLGFFDIETGWCPDRGFAPANDPFNPVTAISVYMSNIERCIALVLKPKTYTYEQAKEIADSFEDTFLFDDEAELLKTFLTIIDDVDCLSGWNSTLFDIPYLVNRITRVLGSDYTRALCLWNQKPRPRVISKHGKDQDSFLLVGRVHLDYLELYQKHNPQQQQSYKLDSIGEIEVGENKVAYEGHLDDLYHKDFYKFIAYSRQDVMLLVKIDAKKQFIELANQIAHVNTVLLQTTMGSVALVEQAIINEMHDLGFVVPCRKGEIEEADAEEDEDDEEDGEDGDKKKPVVGAYVAKPKKGLHSHVACVDINSLYPSAIRALNISPETIVGQLRPTETKALIAERIAAGTKRAEAWDGIFTSVEVSHMLERSGAVVNVDFDDGTTKEMSGRQLHDYIFDPRNKLCITANGTIFRTDKEGIIPKLLAKWYSERKAMQAQKAVFVEAADGGVDLMTHAWRKPLDADALAELEKLLGE